MNRKNKKITFIGLALATVVIIGFLSTSAFKPKQENEAKGVTQMTKAMYIEKIHDFVTSPSTFKYKGTRPAVVDFYADWCRPCKRIAPIMEELSEQYKGKVDFYKVNVDNESELAALHSIQSIPLVIIFTEKGQPNSVMGALNKEEYISLIEESLKK
jgi:thioredoxin 1